MVAWHAKAKSKPLPVKAGSAFKSASRAYTFSPERRCTSHLTRTLEPLCSNTRYQGQHLVPVPNPSLSQHQLQPINTTSTANTAASSIHWRPQYRPLSTSRSSSPSSCSRATQLMALVLGHTLTRRPFGRSRDPTTRRRSTRKVRALVRLFARRFSYNDQVRSTRFRSSCIEKRECG